MPNHSKINDSRFWRLWRAAGAVTSLARSVATVLPTRADLLELFRVKDAPDEPLPGVINIGRDFYVKSQAALDALLAALRVIGYQIDNLREADHRKRDGVSVRRMEQDGWSLWFAKLDTRRGKCNSCGGLIDTRGIEVHGHTCELCGAVTYYKIIDGTSIRFSFVQKEGEEYSMADINMKAKRWDTEAGYLYLYPELTGGLWLRDEKAQAYLDANRDKWDEVEEEGQRLIRVRYRNSWELKDSVINPSDICYGQRNYKMVLVWEGREYDEYFSDFPVRQTINIYEAWHWMPLEASPILHRKVLGSVHCHDDKGWFHQDGRPFFGHGHFVEMGKFVRHFTTLDADAWDKQSKYFRLDSPGCIDDVAAFCHPRAQVQNIPNMFNAIDAMYKMREGQPLTKGEVMAAGDVFRDPVEGGKLRDTLAAVAGAKK